MWAMTVIMDCEVTANNFRTKFGFKKCDFILTKEQPVLTRQITSFAGENM